MAKGERPTSVKAGSGKGSLYNDVEEILNSDSSTKLKRMSQANAYIKQFAKQQGIPESSVNTVDDFAKHLVYDAIGRHSNLILNAALDKRRAELPSSFKRGGDTFVKLPGDFGNRFYANQPGQRVLEHTYTSNREVGFLGAAVYGASQGSGVRTYEVNGMHLVYSGNNTYKIVKNNKKSK